MCGIVGGFTINPKKGFKKDNIEKSLERLKNRGPDGSSIEFIKDNKSFLAHTRLAIVDIENGIQPLWNENKTICAVVNGEFYDYKNLRNGLAKHNFKTNCDSELLIHLYEEFGVECLSKLQGEFAFILHDKIKNQWFLAKDRFGIRPLFYRETNGGLVAASTAMSLLDCIREVPNINPEAVAFSSHYQYLSTPTGMTWFANVQSLPPASFLIMKEGDSSNIEKYWKIPKCTNSNNKPNEWETIHQIKEAVRKRIPDEVKWTTHLSGGLDSAIISLLAREYGLQRAYVVKFQDNKYDESQQAQEVADYIGVDLIKVPVTTKDILSNWESAVLAAESVFINGHGVAKYLLSKKIREDGYKVALTGEGSDEIFYGYSHLIRDYYKNDYEEHSVAGVHTPINGNKKEASWLQAKFELGLPLREIFGLTPKQKIITKSNNVEENANLWIEYALSGYILQTLDDGMGMSNSIESRIPFLDKDLIEWVKNNIPLKNHFMRNTEKAWLRRCFKDMLPKSTIQRRKHPFMAPPLLQAIFLKENEEIYNKIVNANLPMQNKEKTIKWLNSIKNRIAYKEVLPSDEPAVAIMLSLSYLKKMAQK